MQKASEVAKRLGIPEANVHKSVATSVEGELVEEMVTQILPVLPPEMWVAVAGFYLRQDWKVHHDGRVN
jgi:hypothetical protein